MSLHQKLEQLIASWPDDRGDPPDTDYQRGYMAAAEEHARELKEALRAQITSTIRTLASWTEGEFAFNREGAEARAPDALAVSVDPQAVLLELFREQDEAGRDGGAAAAG